MAGSELASAWISIYPKFSRTFNSTVSKGLSTSFNSAMTRLGSSLGSKGSSIGRSLGRSIEKGLSTSKVAIGNVVASAITASVGTITESLDGAVSRVDTLENLPKVMQAWGEESEYSTAIIQKLMDSIEGLPTKTDEITSGVQRLYSILHNLDEASDLGIALNDMMLSNSASTTLAANAFEQFAQMLAVGKVDMMAWRSVVNAAPMAVDNLAKSLLGMDATAMDLYNALPGSKGTNKQGIELEFDDVVKAIIKLDKEGGEGMTSFAEQARSAQVGIATSMKNVKTAIEKNLANIMQAIGRDRISGLFDTIKGQINEFGSWFIDAKVPSLVARLDTVDLETSIERLKTRVRSIVAWTQQNVVPPVEMISGSLRAATDKVFEHVSAHKDDFLTFFSTVLSVVGDIGSRVTDKLGNGLAIAADKAGELVAAFNSRFDEDSFLGALETRVAWLENNVLTPLWENTQRFFRWLETNVAPIVVSIADKLSAKLQEVAPAVGSLADNLAAVVSSAVISGLQYIDVNFEAIWDVAWRIAKSVGELLIFLIGQLPNILTWLHDNRETITSILDNVKGIIEQVGPWLDNFINEHGPQISNVMSGLLDLLDKVLGFINEHFDMVANLVVGWLVLKIAVFPILGGIRSLISRIGAGISGVVNTLKGIPEIIATIGTKLEPLLAKIAPFTKGLTSKIPGIGTALAAGWELNDLGFFDAMAEALDPSVKRSISGGLVRLIDNAEQELLKSSSNGEYSGLDADSRFAYSTIEGMRNDTQNRAITEDQLRSVLESLGFTVNMDNKTVARMMFSSNDSVSGDAMSFGMRNLAYSGGKF